MSIYNGLSGKESNMEASYGLLDMASQVALRVISMFLVSIWRLRKSRVGGTSCVMTCERHFPANWI